ncbi:hypothetical protein BS78_06G289400 [Paspalum vaginatum]|nr:hypothetical protein BS78_06G289400 [Paspalum vaginatum]
MDGKELISPSDLQSFYHQQQQHQHQQQHGASLGGHSGSPSSLAGMHSVIRPMPNMPNMNMSPTDILNSIGGGSLAGMHHHQFQMDHTAPPLLHNSAMPSPVSASGAAVQPHADPPLVVVKRKRGRPRKYGPDGTMKQQRHLVNAAAPRMGSMPGADMMGAGAGMEDPAAQKKRRGRPPGTGKKQQPSPSSAGNAFAGSAGTGFTPHVITASPTEDVAAKIAAFASQSSRAVCVLSATGSVSRVVLRHPADGSPMSRLHTSPQQQQQQQQQQLYKNPAVYEGFYEILSLTGSYNLAEGQQSGGLSVTLCSPERNVIGGVLAGALVAATIVQVVLGSFHQGGSKSKSKKAGKQAAFSSDSLTAGVGVGQEASPSSGHNQNLTPTSVTGGWPTSGIFDTRSSTIDINSSRG